MNARYEFTEGELADMSQGTVLLRNGGTVFFKGTDSLWFWPGSDDYYDNAELADEGGSFRILWQR